MGHLGVGEDGERDGVEDVDLAGEARVLLEALADPEEPAEHHGRQVKGDEDLGSRLADNCVGEVVEPVILVSVPAQGVLGPVVDTVDAPKEGDVVARPMHPVHAEAHHQVVHHEPREPLAETVPTSPKLGLAHVKAVDEHIHEDLQERSGQHAARVVPLEPRKLVPLPSAKVFPGLQLVLVPGLRSLVGQREEAGLKVGVVKPPEHAEPKQYHGQVFGGC
mmetsp:Transcript_13482/g.24795  ORF Transcript_13482/g.24795 Transcript_13482/m.24795 type:complete len:220 (+) Transcript_13482:590-1249(+)